MHALVFALEFIASIFENLNFLEVSIIGGINLHGTQLIGIRYESNWINVAGSELGANTFASSYSISVAVKCLNRHFDLRSGRDLILIS